MKTQGRFYLTSFNEAGALTPRKGAWHGADAGNRRRFNEAGALTPRKDAGSLPVSIQDSDSFNEAGALTPRKVSAAPKCARPSARLQ